MKAKLLSIIFMTVGVLSLQAALLDETGRPYQEIVVAPDAADTVKLAATELQKFTNEICKANLKIVNKATKSPVIYVGKSPELTKIGITADKLPSEGYQIQTGKGFLAIIGRDYKGGAVIGPRNPWNRNEVYNTTLKLGMFGEAGTLTGVYEFLRKVGNMRFYMPGELGTVVTPAPNLTVPKLALSGAPRVNYRYPWYSRFEYSPESALWAHRVGFGGKSPVVIMHSYCRFQKYRKSHPEYFAIIDGKRAFDKEGVIMGGGNLCLTNQDAVKQWSENIIDYFKTHPNMDVYPLVPNDGLIKICECPNCQAELRPDAGETGKYSYYIWNFTRKVAALVAKQFPHKYVGCLAYEAYRKPPVEIQTMPNVAVMFCNHRSLLANPDEKADLHKEIETWSKKVDRIYLWNWYLDHWMPWKGLPIVFTDTINDELKYMFKNPKYSGEFIESEGQGWGNSDCLTTPGLQHLNLYVTGRLYWEPDLDLDALVNEYCHLFYGPASIPMKSFWLSAQKRHHKIVSENLQAKPDDMFTPAVLAKLNASLKQASDATQANSVYRKRVELIQKEFNIGSGRLTRVRKLGFKKLNLPVINTKKPFEKIKPVKFLDKSGKKYDPETWLCAGYDKQYLWFKFICNEPKMENIKAKIKGNDTDWVWLDDSIEIFICPDETNRKKCYQVVFNTNGAVYDVEVRFHASNNVKWNSDSKVHVTKEKNRWVAEIRIPFANLGIADSSFTGNLAANFYRNRIEGKTLTRCGWSPTGEFKNYVPEKFGILILEK